MQLILLVRFYFLVNSVAAEIAASVMIMAKLKVKNIGTGLGLALPKETVEQL